MSRLTWKTWLAGIGAIVAVVTSAPAQAAPVTACTALDICYCINSDRLGAITANVARVRQLIADNKAKGKAIGYLSVPLSSVGGTADQSRRFRERRCIGRYRALYQIGWVAAADTFTVPCADVRRLASRRNRKTSRTA